HLPEPIVDRAGRVLYLGRQFMTLFTPRGPSQLSLEQFVWRAIKRHRWLGLLMCLLVWGLSALLWMDLPRTYEADAYILISTDRINSGNQQTSTQEAAFINTQVQLLRTDKVIEAAVSRVGRENLASARSLLGWFVYRSLGKEAESPEAFMRALKNSLSIQIEAK